MSLTIRKITDPEFKEYGKVWEGMDTARLLKEMEHTPLPEDVIYVPSLEQLEVLPVTEDVKNRVYGGLPVQAGYCNGNNHKLNALEYHRNSEINVAVTDMILLLGKLQDVTEDFLYDTEKVEAFLVPSGTVVEMYETTLHYAPCNVAGNGFRCVVILPQGTNTRIDFTLPGQKEDILMTAKKQVAYCT